MGEPITGLYFNKLMSLIHKTLNDKHGIDIKLPHCWYRYGDEVVRYLMPNHIKWNHESPQYTSVFWDGYDHFSETETVSLIEDSAREIVEKYKNKSKEEIVDDVYSLAPFDFQRNFRQLRLNIERMSFSYVGIENFEEKILVPSLERTISSFPKHDFPQEVFERVNNYGLLIKRLLEMPEFDVETAKEATEDVWFYFSYYLRTHKKCHENIPKNVLEYWESQIEFEKEKFDRFFAEILVFLNQERGVSFDGELQKIIENRMKEEEEELEFIENF